MTLNTSGALLEEMRFSSGNSAYTFPPSNKIHDDGLFSQTKERSEYLVLAHTLNSEKFEFDIADPDLAFCWSRNDVGVSRFDYDSYSNRWLPLQGTSPVVVGNLSNNPRISIPPPNQDKLADSPCLLYIDDDPRVSFTLKFIGSGSFSDPSSIPVLTVEINSSGHLNFSLVDASLHKDKPVLHCGQNFVSRMSGNGNIGKIPDFSSTDYRMFLNPKPASGQIPRIRIGYGPHLTVEEVQFESGLSSPPKGVVRWAIDTGRIKLSAEDVENNLEETVKYDGVFMGVSKLSRRQVDVVGAWPKVSFNLPEAVGEEDISRFVVFAEKAGEIRRYFPTVSCSSKSPPTGWCCVDPSTGNFYLSQFDVASYSGWSFWCVDCFLEIGAPGVVVKMKRSSVNGAGKSSVPDFVVSYKVSQTLSDDLPPYPFMMLPTIPTVDSNLRFQIDVGTGKFVGDLVDSSEPSKHGLGYLLNLDLKQLKFTVRTYPRAVVLQKDQYSIKLDGAALSSRGVEVRRNGHLLSKSDFDIDTSSGVVEFVESVGEGEENSIEVSGTTSGSVFTSDLPLFSKHVTGKRLLVYSGKNSGIYEIVSVKSNSSIEVSPEFDSNEKVSASVRSTDEIIADRLWIPVKSTPKKFSIYRKAPGGVSLKIDADKHLVKPNSGQVSLSDSAVPGEKFKIEYISIDSDDSGGQVFTKRSEPALFKISQESASFSVGSKTVLFNEDGNTVNTSRPISLYIDGVTQDPESFTFSSPGTLILQKSVESGPVKVNYWVEEASGGETVMDLLHYPIDYDSLKVSGPEYGEIEGQTEMTVSGNQTNDLVAGCALLLEDSDMVYVSESSYDQLTDLTHVSFRQSILSDSENIKATGHIEGSYFITETNPAEIFVIGSNSIKIHGDVSKLYKSGTVVDMDGDPYWVFGSSYDESTGVTVVTTSGRARRNYISPVVKRSVRPVLDPSSSFSTSRLAYISRGFVLAKMGKSSSVLQNGIDYDVGEDGVIELKSKMSHGDVLRAMYVAKSMQPEGTEFEFNFSREIAPDSSNGLAGQKLVAHYNLYAPDSFFYRVETVVTMLPEAKEAMVDSSSSMPYGPNVSNSTSQAVKNSGSAGPWYGSRHYQNVDVVSQRFLLYYHDLISKYEDLSSLIDGKKIGGESGRFRYDGVMGRVVDSYKDVLNDIDDKVALYKSFSKMSGFPPKPTYSWTYGKMSDSNGMSRLFPTSKIASSFIEDTSSAKSGQQVGNFNATNILSVGTTVTSRSCAYFTSAVSASYGTQFTVDSSTDSQGLLSALAGMSASFGQNGDDESMTPPFKEDQKIQVFDLDGNKVASGKVLSIDSTTPHLLPTTVPFSSVVHAKFGSIAQIEADFENNDANMQNMYTPGVDYSVSNDTGLIKYVKIPSMFPLKNNPLVGDEIVQAQVSFNNPNLSPNRFPALDGSEMNDSKRLPIPRTRVDCELRRLMQEVSITNVGFARYPKINDVITDISSSILISVGDSITFVNGPNSGYSVVVSSIMPTGIITSPFLTNVDGTGSSFVVNIVSFKSIIGKQLNFLKSEMSKLDDMIGMFGTNIMSGNGAATSDSVWVDSSGSNFSGTDGMLLHVKDGPSRGLYRVESASTEEIFINKSLYPHFEIGNGKYSIIDPWPFLQESEFLFVAPFYRETNSFYSYTSSWMANPSWESFQLRMNKVNKRRSYLSGIVGGSGQINYVLTSGDNLYDTRFLWIDQRTNKETGLVQLQARSMERAEESLKKLKENQRKKYLMDKVAGYMATE